MIQDYKRIQKVLSDIGVNVICQPNSLRKIGLSI